MFRTIRVSFAPVLAACLSACAEPQAGSPPVAQQHHFTVDFAALGDRTSEIDHWIVLDGDCSVAGFL